jgi:hypothetical protein
VRTWVLRMRIALRRGDLQQVPWETGWCVRPELPVRGSQSRARRSGYRRSREGQTVVASAARGADRADRRLPPGSFKTWAGSSRPSRTASCYRSLRTHSTATALSGRWSEQYDWRGDSAKRGSG